MSKHLSALYLLIILLLAVIITEKMNIVLSVKKENISCQPLNIDYNQPYPFCIDRKEEQYILHTKRAIVLSSTDNTVEESLYTEEIKTLQSKDIDWKVDGVSIDIKNGKLLFIKLL